MIEQLFGSKTRVKLLQLFLANPNRSFYVREITRKIEEQINSVRRELANLLSIGIITSDSTNNRLYYEVNQKYEYFEALAVIFGGKAAMSAKLKASSKKKGADKDATEAVEPVTSSDPLAEQFKKAGNLSVLLLSGQFTRDDSAGIDMLIVGDMNESKVDKIVADTESSENKQIRYAIFTVTEFSYRRQINDRFVSNILLAKKQILVDADNLLS